MSIQPLPCVPPENPVSALISPFPPPASIAIAPNDQSSTQAVEFSGFPARGGSLQRFFPWGACLPSLELFSARIALPSFISMTPSTRIRIGQALAVEGPVSLQLVLAPGMSVRFPAT